MLSRGPTRSVDAGRGTDGRGGGDDPRPAEIGHEEVLEVFLADVGELAHAARRERPIEAAIGAQVVVAAADAGHEDGLRADGEHAAAWPEHHRRIAIRRDDDRRDGDRRCHLRHRHRLNYGRRGGDRNYWRSGDRDRGCGDRARRTGRHRRRRVADKEVFTRRIDPRQVQVRAAAEHEHRKSACQRAERDFLR